MDEEIITTEITEEDVDQDSSPVKQALVIGGIVIGSLIAFNVVRNGIYAIGQWAQRKQDAEYEIKHRQAFNEEMDMVTRRIFGG